MNPLLSGREILIVEDETILRKRLARFLEEEGALCSAFGTMEEGSNALDSLSFDFALIDVHLPDGLGLDLLEKASGVSVVIMTADGGWEIAVEAMRRGAADYIAKPFELPEIPLVLGRCASTKRQDRKRQHRERQIVHEDTGGGVFFGKSLQALKSQFDKIRAVDNRLTGRLPPVLIEGETGTGKSTLARWLHASGPRRSEELVVVNCAALPENLAESELFGHEKGSFTDAKEKRIGLFEAADGGTLFLDEIASLSLPLQAKVLVAVEEGKIRRVGGSSEISIDARLIVASNRNLEQLASSGDFREDLYHRLNLLRVVAPPLRERKEDIVLLAEHMAAGLAARYQLDRISISDTGKRQLLSYDWPGNVRELSHELERALILGEAEDLEFPSLSGFSNTEILGSKDDWLNPLWEFPEEGISLEDAINRLIQKALDHTNGNVSGAARLLGVQRDYIRYRLKKHP